MSHKINKTKHTQTPHLDYVNKSLNALQNKQYSTAIELAQKAIKINPRHYAGYEVLARAYEHNGDIQKAYEIVTQNPSTEHTLHHKMYIGELAANNGFYQEAIFTFAQILTDTPQNVEALTGLVYCYTRLNDHINKYLALKTLKTIKPLSLEQIYSLAYALQKINVQSGVEAVLTDIDEILSNPKFDGRILATKAGELLIQYLSELNTPESINVDSRLFHTPLLWSIIEKTCICNIKIDLFLMYTRKNLLLHLMEKGEIDDDLLRVCKSLSAQNFLNEYIHYVDATEKEIIQGLLQVIELNSQVPEWKPADSEAIFHILLMYMPLQAMTFATALAQHPLHGWPESLQSIAQKTLFLPLLEIETGKKTPKLTNISYETPSLVNSQYEENPYPRWQGTYCNPSHTLGHYINYLHPQLPLGKEFFKPGMSILIAGCGTGKQAIDAALLYPESKIVAFDISLRSLGYAQIKAKEYGTTNISFFHGDILELSDDVGQFDYIECCGVLHHLKDPLAGWQKLLDRLKPDGVMRVDLYSKIARHEITERKKQISQLNIDTSIDSLRMFRRAMVAQNNDNIFYDFSDFYNTSEFRDLLFHTQESQYTLIDIKEVIQSLDLNFIALFVDQDKQLLFRSEYPEGDIHDLTLWNNVEMKFPKLFASMYAFWCQKKS